MVEVEHKRTYTWECPKCGKVLTSLWYKQLLEWREIHEFSHHLKKIKEKEKKHGKTGKSKKS
jgi:hypothetical protein